jgi:hypothetical protein
MSESFYDSRCSRGEFIGRGVVVAVSVRLGFLGRHLFKEWTDKRMEEYIQALAEIDEETRKAMGGFRLLARDLLRPKSSEDFWQVVSEDISFNRRLYPTRFLSDVSLLGNKKVVSYLFNLSGRLTQTFPDITLTRTTRGSKTIQKSAEVYYNNALEMTHAPAAISEADYTMDGMLLAQEEALREASTATRNILRQPPMRAFQGGKLNLSQPTKNGAPQLVLAEAKAEIPGAKHTYSVYPLHRLRLQVDYS